MAKMKTSQSIAKRFKVTKTGKIEKRASGQGHYNAREDGATGRQKKSDVIMSKTIRRPITTYIQN